jgi:hypothetical protein
MNLNTARAPRRSIIDKNVCLDRKYKSNFTLDSDGNAVSDVWKDIANMRCRSSPKGLSNVRSIAKEQRHSTACSSPKGDELEEDIDTILWECVVELTNEFDALRNRVFLLESRNKSFFKLNRTLSGQKSTNDVFDGSFAKRGGGLRTCIDLISVKRVALLQCIWLGLCLALFGGVALALFLVAHSNEHDKWKSEKKDYTIDYTDEATNHQYEMPYVYIFFKSDLPYNDTADWLSQGLINNKLEDLLKSQNYFINKTGFFYLNLHDIYSSFSEVEAVVSYDDQ